MQARGFHHRRGGDNVNMDQGGADGLRIMGRSKGQGAFCFLACSVADEPERTFARASWIILSTWGSDITTEENTGMGKLEKKVAIIVGGASGIGEATAKLFAHEGACVVVADIADDRGEEVAGQIGKAAVYRHTDVTDESSVQACISFTVNQFGRLDCMSNNAAGNTGVGSLPIEDITVKGFQRAMDLFVLGVVLCVKHAAPIMKRQGSGSIINTASIAGRQAGRVCPSHLQRRQGGDYSAHPFGSLGTW